MILYCIYSGYRYREASLLTYTESYFITVSRMSRYTKISRNNMVVHVTRSTTINIVVDRDRLIWKCY